MIENLTGIYETVSYDTDLYIKLYDNTDLEAYPRHWHTCVEIITPLIGDYRMEYASREVTLKVGDILILCPGTLHSFEACPGERYIFQAEIPSTKQMRSVQSFLTLFYPGVLLRAEEDTKTYQQVRDLLWQIFEEYQQEPALFDASIYAKLLEIFVLIRRALPPANGALGASFSKQQEYLDTFMDICGYLNEHCTEDLNLEEVADRAGFSKYHFSRLFKQFTNVSFYKYLNQKRIETAERLLIRPEMSVTEISLACGFQSLSSFIRMFKLIKGCTPSAYRGLIGQGGERSERET